MDLKAILVDHSCDANSGVTDNEAGAYDFVALRRIDVGEELFWDYECAEYEVNVPFKYATEVRMSRCASGL